MWSEVNSNPVCVIAVDTDDKARGVIITALAKPDDVPVACASIISAIDPSPIHSSADRSRRCSPTESGLCHQM